MRLILFLSMVLTFQAAGFAQKGETVKRGILSSKKDKDKVSIIKEEKKIKVWINGHEEPVKGKYTIVNDSVIRIEEADININTINKIRAPRLFTKIAGGILVTGGAVFTGVGLSVIVISLNSNELGAAFGLLIGIITTIFGVIPTVIGVPVFFIGKKFKTEDYQFSIQT